MTGAIRESFYGRLPDEMPPHPTHCQKCGRELVYLVERDSFRPTSGEPIETPTWRCPLTIGWWNRAVMMRMMLHDEYAPDHFGEWYWRRRMYW